MPKVNLTPYQRHCHRWRDGCGSSICEGASKVVLGKGRLPCDVLFVGEAPGESEDVVGQPFVGPAGHLLDRIVREAFGGKGWCPTCLRGNHRVQIRPTPAGMMCDNGHEGVPSEFRLAYTNLVGCIPRDGDGRKAGEPDYDEILRCSDRLQEFVKIADPRLVVHVGALSKKHGPGPRKGRTIDIVHPAAILRANVAQQGLMIQRSIVHLSNAVEEL